MAKIFKREKLILDPLGSVIQCVTRAEDQPLEEWLLQIPSPTVPLWELLRLVFSGACCWN